MVEINGVSVTVTSDGIERRLPFLGGREREGGGGGGGGGRREGGKERSGEREVIFIPKLRANSSPVVPHMLIQNCKS